ncbi:MAG: homoserine dehydrogenase [Deltaproteobacteria bacterium]|nr:homoserine dehydrogenase [Deltaproteobacteria bacterium]
MKKEFKIGLLGCGSVGTEVVRLLSQKKKLLEARSGLQFTLKKIAVRDLKKKRPSFVDQKLLTTRPEDVVGDPEIDIVVELMGGLETPEPLVLQAIRNGKSVVTGNKALLAERGLVLFQEAREKRVPIGFEASVAGGIPLLQAVSQGLIANEIEASYGIINGTSNYILSAMADHNLSFETALKEAQGRGFAEADPGLDIDGTDAAHKLSILATLCYGTAFPFRQVYIEGIRKITPFEIEMAKRFAYRIKLLAISRKSAGGIQLRVHPTMIPEIHPLASVSGGFNAITLIGDAVGETMFYGLGAGGRPTASAVVSDIVSVARGMPLPVSFKKEVSIESIDDLRSEYYLRFTAVDKPGVLSRIAGILGANEISIATVYQHEQDTGSKVPIVIMTHECREKNLKKALVEIDKLDAVAEPTLLVHVDKLKGH